MTGHLKHSLSLALVLLAIAPDLAGAETPPELNGFEACGMDSRADWEAVAPYFEGTWIAQHKAGVAKTAQGIMPFPTQPDPETFSFIHTANGLLTHKQGAEAELLFNWVDEPRWRFNDVTDGRQTFTPEFDDNELSVILGCTLE